MQITEFRHEQHPDPEHPSHPFSSGARGGITSICSAHPLVIEAALLEGIATNTDVLIEATCNQVNQDGGYTGMTPADFRRFVEDIAARLGFDTKRLILGGDHLGPNPWKHLSAEEALAKSEVMMDGFVRAGFTKIHLDTSMGCAGEPVALPDAITAERAARLARVAEKQPPNPVSIYLFILWAPKFRFPVARWKKSKSWN